MAADGNPGRASLVSRIKGILIEPKVEWPKIEAEPETVGSLYTNYIIPLAGFAVLCSFISSLRGVTVFGVTYRATYFEALTSAAWQFGLALVLVFVLALIMNTLAPVFGGQKDQLKALKLAAYSATASWLANVFVLIPWLGFLTLLGIYNLYLVRTGAPVLLHVPEKRALGFTASLVGVGIVLALVYFALAPMVMPTPQAVGESAEDSSDSPAGKITVPGVGTIDLGKLNKVGKRAEGLAKGDGPSPAIDAEALKGLLPADLPGGYRRSEFSENNSVGTSMASAVYANGEKTITLSIADMGMAGVMTSLAESLGASANETTDHGYRRFGSVNGRMTMEELELNDKTGIYSFMVTDRVMIKAEGNGASMDDLKAAAGSIDSTQVQALAQE